jgi:hypothetical protein
MIKYFLKPPEDRGMLSWQPESKKSIRQRKRISET